MRLSRYFVPTLKNDPSDAQVVSHKLMVRGGMIRQVTSGVYNWLPLGLKTLRKVENIVREEMNKAGALEVLMPTVQPSELWQETGRWEKYGKELLRFTDRHNHESCLGPTHEEVITDLFRNNVQSYKDLPLNMYQIQTKFRDEVRPRFGLMRGREFTMKDAYSFDASVEDGMKSYEIMKTAYHGVFKRLGLDYRMVYADTGSIGGDHSHEFHVLADTGEDDLLFDPNGEYAVNVEKHDPENCPVSDDKLEKKKGIEVGHIFLLKDNYSKPMNAEVTLKDGSSVAVTMGCYGIGVSRVVAAAIEQNNDENGMIWPLAMAPYQIGLINLKAKDEETTAACDKLYESFQAQGFEVLYDDRNEGAGGKFANMDLIGLPWQCVVGPRGLAEGKLEWKNRRTGEKLELPMGELPSELQTATSKAA